MSRSSSNDRGPRLSYGARTLILEVVKPGMSRREFLKRSLITVGGVAFLSLALDTVRPRDARGAVTCCYSNCYG